MALGDVPRQELEIREFDTDLIEIEPWNPVLLAERFESSQAGNRPIFHQPRSQSAFPWLLEGLIEFLWRDRFLLQKDAAELFLFGHVGGVDQM